MKLERRSVFGWPATAAVSAPCKNGLVVHYDGSNLGLAGKDHSSCRAYWKATRKFHMGPARGWLDIGYSFGVCPHGIVMEGRGWQRTQAAQPGGNTSWTSCTFMSGDAEKPTAAQIEAFKELRAWLRDKGLASAIKGHKDFISTSCPGSILYRMVRDGSLTGAPTSPGTPPPSGPSWTETLMQQLPTVKRGDSGEDVQSVQGLLQARSHPEVSIDGDFGAKTETAVKGLQNWAGLTADGIVGPKTWAALLRLAK
jgi:hypothetical protein